MTNAARIAAFKSKTLALIDTLQLTHEEVVGLGLTFAVTHAVAAGIGDDDLDAMLRRSLADCRAAGKGSAAT